MKLTKKEENMKYILIALITIVFIGCSTNPIQIKPIDKMSKNEIYDLVHLPQSVKPYLKNIKIDSIKSTQHNYEENYFRVWNKIPADSKETAMWPFRAYNLNESYGENLQPLEENFFLSMKNNANFEKYKTINKNALTLNHLNIRGFPTAKPLLRNPSLAGEGFPFDYMQNSTISANKPILVSHYSKDKEWVYIFTSFTGGWVKANEIVIVDKKYTNLWQKAQQVFLIKDGIPIYDKNSRFLFKSKIGMMLALVSEDSQSYTVLTVASYKGDKPLYLKSKISKTIAHKGIMRYTKENITLIMDEISKSKYGWGGIYNQRDCSSTLRDFYAPFGLWLPRNSSQQAKKGKVIQLDGLSKELKIKTIKDEAIPFKTLFYKKGHILLYVGTYDDTIVVFHNIWGIRTKEKGKEGRLVVGKAIFSSLSLGSHQRNFDKEAEILTNLKSMNILSW